MFLCLRSKKGVRRVSSTGAASMIFKKKFLSQGTMSGALSPPTPCCSAQSTVPSAQDGGSGAH